MISPRAKSSPYDHNRYLALEIGPRPATSENEARARDYVSQQLQAAGYAVETQPFRSIRSFTLPWLIVSELFVASAALFWVYSDLLWRGVAACLTCLAFLLYWGLVSGVWRAHALFPKGNSANLSANAPSVNPGKRVVVLMAHLDSTRACLLWHPKLVKNFGPSFQAQTVILALQTAAAIGAVVFPNIAWLKWLMLPGALLSVWGIIVLLHRETVLDWVQGANDNASGVAVCLSLMDALKLDPLQQTEVVGVFTGCEEVGAPVGAEAFLKARGAQFKEAYFLIVDNVGAGDPRYLTAEGMMPRRHAHPELLNLAQQLAQANPEWNFKPSAVPPGAYTDALPYLAKGYRAMALWSEKEGALPNWHWHTDTLVRVEPEALDKMMIVLLAMLKQIDREGIE